MTEINIDKYKIEHKNIHFVCNDVVLDKLTAKELKNIEDQIQKRVVSAIDLAVNIKNKGYNVFAIGPTGSGKKDFIKNIIERKDPKKELSDLCYIHNFENSNNPVYIKLKAGDGTVLKKDIATTLKDLKIIIPSVFKNSTYLAKIHKLKEDFMKQEGKDLEQINQCAKEMNLTIKQGKKEYGVIPLKKDGSPMQESDVKQLTEKDKEDLNSRFKVIQQKLQKFLEKQPLRENELITKVDNINEKQVKIHTTKIFNKLRRKWNKKDSDRKIKDYLHGLEQATVDNYKLFFENTTKEINESYFNPMSVDNKKILDDIFTIHLISKPKDKNQTPIIAINNPTAENLFGTIHNIDGKNEVIKGGAFHYASDGYLILDASKILVQPQLWEQIKYTLKYQSIKIHKKENILNLISTSQTSPENIPNTAKIIMVGSGQIYNALIKHDNEFNNLFKLVANFTNTLEINKKSIKFFYNKLLDITKNENMLNISKDGFTKIVKEAAKEVGDKTRITTNFRKMADILREGNHVAKANNSRTITREHLSESIASHITRVNILSSHIKDSIKDNTILINTKGEKVGQINGLAVYKVYGHTFGQPQRITANSYHDKSGIISIQKSSDMSGKIYSKASMIVNSFIKSKFSKVKEFNFGVSVNFEQSYSYIDGDSASIAEVLCILSSLSNMPIKQSLAITGAMSQTGEVLAIGGVNEKIEGFFDICKEKGTKNNGVVIPKANIKNILLREDIDKAVKEGSFTIYSIENINQAIEIFFNAHAGNPNKNGTYKKDSSVYSEIYHNFFEPSE